ncbi:asparagine synthase (glutamine-hydrolysing) [Christiangramia gaetbulicola]|uniref:asparagine synthase (glutamine-hydrolyzing) n=1 Tax=Christiangramia gaetbulicola TaxID=703340 RepID=A0A2T6AJX9_9FLAO|nr:asparagine synthase (glutamine-hydrolyzing) [Christiangramia gaetbulicola]PTX44097.1 asparagine synthase (glutamine-hydrolysing) [Christiangramia gaetbulicola]
MCGIAGIISPYNRKQDLKKLLQTQKHRGPDNTGSCFDEGYAALGHNRLSILDLSQAANQPFKDSSGRYALVFNGEIYNYREIREELSSIYDFRTQSDTEVLLAAYIKFGKTCLEKLNGMFSFAIWDSKEKILFAARDRFGVKPFYYTQNPKEFIFASEIKSLKKVSAKNDPSLKVWASYFAYGSYGEPYETFYKDHMQLPAGHYLVYKNEKLSINKWYDFIGNVNRIEISNDAEYVKSRYFEILKESISLRFRSDVEVGFNISGGVDSSLLLALVNLYKANDKIKAYTFYTGNPDYDELAWVEKMVEKTRNPLTKVLLTASEVKSFSKEISAYQDEPYGGIPTMAYSKIFKQARKDNVIVLLDGQGMDEQWAGYDYYSGRSTSVIQGQKKGSSPFKSHCLSDEFQKIAKRTEYPEPFENKLQNLQYRDLFYTKIPRALRFNDRISMMAGTELREPFLDHRLVEYAFAQPEKFKIQGNIQKYLLRELIKDLVPPDISSAPKRALQTPQREWLGKELQEFVRENLKTLKKSSWTKWFNHTEIEKEWQNYLRGDQDSSFHIWQWINAAQILSE